MKITSTVLSYVFSYFAFCAGILILPAQSLAQKPCEEGVSLSLDKIWAGGGDDVPSHLLDAAGFIKRPANDAERDQHEMFGFKPGDQVKNHQFSNFQISAGSLYYSEERVRIGSKILFDKSGPDITPIRMEASITAMDLSNDSKPVSTIKGKFLFSEDGESPVSFEINIWHRPALGWDALSTLIITDLNGQRYVSAYNMKTHLKFLGRVRPLRRTSRRGRGW